MGLKDTRSKAIECLKMGRVQAAERPDINEKNLLKTGLITSDFVIKLLNSTRGEQYKTQPHKDDSGVLVHYFEPTVAGEDWHIKLYFLDPDCWFISVHKSHLVKKTKKKAGKRYGNFQRRR